MNFIRPPFCDRLGIPLLFDTGEPSLSAAALANPPAYDRARAVAQYDGVMRDLIHAFKYSDRHEAARLFARWLTAAAEALIPHTDLVIPVPLSRWRLLSRRFNQAGVLAGELARRTGLPIDHLALKRKRRTLRQVGLTAAQRRQNVSGAFELATKSGQLIRKRLVLLVDDIITTGATVEACARVLKKGGARSVDVLALARVVAPQTPSV